MKPAILQTLTENFAVPSFAYALQPLFSETKKFDKTLQSYSLFPDEACVLLDKYSETINLEARKEMGKALRNFYSDNGLNAVVPPGRINRQ